MSLIIPGSQAPNNLVLGDNVGAKSFVEGDLYNICKRIQEISPALKVIQLEDDAKDCAYAIMELCDDGWERIVCKVKELDARILERIEIMRKIPLEVRAARIERELDEEEAKEKEFAREKMFEEMGLPMLHEFEKTGFIGKRSSHRNLKGAIKR